MRLQFGLARFQSLADTYSYSCNKTRSGKVACTMPNIVMVQDKRGCEKRAMMIDDAGGRGMGFWEACKDMQY